MPTLFALLLRGARRQPSTWILGMLLIASGPLFRGLGRSGALAQRDRLDASWLQDASWIGAVAGILLALRWLGRAPGLRWTRATEEAWRDDMVLIGTAAGAGALATVWPALLTGSVPALFESQRIAFHLTVLAILSLQACRLGPRAWMLFAAIACGAPLLGAMTPGWLAPWFSVIGDPRASGPEGLLIVAGLVVLSLSVAWCSTWNIGDRAGRGASV